MPSRHEWSPARQLVRRLHSDLMTMGFDWDEAILRIDEMVKALREGMVYVDAAGKESAPIPPEGREKLWLDRLWVEVGELERELTGRA